MLTPIATLLLLLPSTQAAWDPSRYMWYSGPAGNFAGTLPIGNGRVAAAIYGTPTDKLTLNENSVWSGTWLDRASRNSLKALADIRSKLKNGDITGAGQSVLNNMAGNPTSPRQYHPLVDLGLDLGHTGATYMGYTRLLDLETGAATVSYAVNGVNYTREYVASYPAGVLAARISASQEGKLNLKVSLNRTRDVKSTSANTGADSSSVTMVAGSGIEFTAEARIVNTGGNVAKSGSAIQVTGATSVDLFFNAESSYRYPSQSAREAELKKKLDAAVAAKYPSIRDAAIADHANLMRRVSLNFGSSGSAGQQPTDYRLTNIKKASSADPEFMVLNFNYGRHLLVASSRDTGAKSLPANLQGIWNDNYSPPWQSKYTININTEMNYWPALVTNIAETHKPLFDLIDIAMPRGQEVAKIMYGCGNDGGFVLHHNTDLWGDAAPVDKGTPYMMWPMGGVWLSAHMMEHYRYTQDTNFLRQRAWPVLQNAANFFYCYMFSWENSMQTGPSLSPENPFIVPNGMTRAGASEGIDISPTMDIQLLHELFTNIIETATVLNITGSAKTKAQDYLSRLPPWRINSSGKLQEWRKDYSDAEPGHRHMSPVYGLYPGSNMSPLINNTLANACKVLVDKRMSSGSGSTGWSRTWVMNLYARLFDGEKVWSNAWAQLQKYPTANLWNSDSGPGSAFQIDGNFGFTAGIAEMLLQSQAGVVHILPALPSAVPKGSFTGLVARGNFVVDAQWDSRKLVKAVVESRSGGTLKLRVAGGGGLMVDGAKSDGTVQTTAGKKYTVTLA